MTISKAVKCSGNNFCLMKAKLKIIEWDWLRYCYSIITSIAGEQDRKSNENFLRWRQFLIKRWQPAISSSIICSFRVLNRNERPAYWVRLKYSAIYTGFRKQWFCLWCRRDFTVIHTTIVTAEVPWILFFNEISLFSRMSLWRTAS